MYSLAFVSKDVPYIVEEALKAIPAKSDFYKCIADVITWHRASPSDWHSCWQQLQQKWANERGCPDGVNDPFDIDAKLNAAYVVMGLLYGNGDFSRSLEVATRAGQDADCNPSTVGGVLGAMLGYSHIPSYWKMGLKEAETIDFKYTHMSLEKVYTIGLRHALENIRRHGGVEADGKVSILLQKPKAVRLEQCFPGMRVVSKTPFAREPVKEEGFDFNGLINGIALGSEKHLGPHPSYTKMIDRLISKVRKDNPTTSAKQVLETVANEARILIEATEGKINKINP